ncbi:MAG TPA: tetratricopeptide repeat protein, partial [Gemmatimonadales bacterium]|nr:tetratricopeptide repeat protein [Gemmatimonadales bacterium]
TLTGIYLIACFFKENALVMPGLLVAAEVLLVPAGEAWGARVSRLRRLLLLLLLVAVSFYGVRTLVLRGDLIGSFTAEGLAYLTMGQRGLTMLAVVPHWFRLLLWPAHLQADYSPAELVAQTAWGPEQTLGALLVLGTLLAFLLAWHRRAPAISFGIAWMAIAIFPVHNVLVPTGIVLAERTLFLPSIGALLALGGLGAILMERASEGARLALAAAVGALLILGVARSTTRHPVWADQFGLWYYTANRDAPRSYRAHHALAEMYFLAGSEARAEREYRLAIEYSPPRIGQVYLDYANKLRLKGFCYPALALYQRMLEIHPNDMAARASLVACLMKLGRYRQALGLARIGISYDWQRPTWQWLRDKADSAWRAGAPPGSINIQVTDSVAAYMKIGTKP